MKRPKLAALAVVTSEDRVILVRRKSEPDAGLWGFPGGHVELGESVAAAASRELREETTVIATPGGILAGLDAIARTEAGEVAHHHFLVAVACAYVSGAPIGCDDVSDAAWFTRDEVLGGSITLSKDVDHVLKLALGGKS